MQGQVESVDCPQSDAGKEHRYRDFEPEMLLDIKEHGSPCFPPCTGIVEHRYVCCETSFWDFLLELPEPTFRKHHRGMECVDGG